MREEDKTPQGYVYLERKIQENYLWLAEPFTRAQAWVDLILLANHTRSSFIIRGIKINVARGEVARSEETLARRWKWSKGKVRRFLKQLKIDQQIQQVNHHTINKISILNYEFYQNKTDKQYNKRTTDGKADGKHTSNDKKEIRKEEKPFKNYFYKKESENDKLDKLIKKTSSSMNINGKRKYNADERIKITAEYLKTGRLPE